MILGIVVGIMGVGAVAAGIYIHLIFRGADSFKLIQGKLENTDSAIADAMPYLKITNEWSKQ